MIPNKSWQTGSMILAGEMASGSAAMQDWQAFRQWQDLPP
jgi:hypothetical protein